MARETKDDGWVIEPGTQIRVSDVLRFRYPAEFGLALRRVLHVKTIRNGFNLTLAVDPYEMFKLVFASGALQRETPVRGVEVASSGSGIRPRTGDLLRLRGPIHGLRPGLVRVLMVFDGQATLIAHDGPGRTSGTVVKLQLAGLRCDLLPPGDFELVVPGDEGRGEAEAQTGLRSPNGCIPPPWPTLPGDFILPERGYTISVDLAAGTSKSAVHVYLKPKALPLDSRREHQRAVEAALVAHPSLNAQAFRAASASLWFDDGRCGSFETCAAAKRDLAQFVDMQARQCAIDAGSNDVIRAYRSALRALAHKPPTGPWTARRRR